MDRCLFSSYTQRSVRSEREEVALYRVKSNSKYMLACERASIVYRATQIISDRVQCLCNVQISVLRLFGTTGRSRAECDRRIMLSPERFPAALHRAYSNWKSVTCFLQLAVTCCL